MVTRISTAAMHDLALTAMLRQQSLLSKTQNQIATGKRVQTPADDPVAAAQLYDLARAQSQVDQYDKNSTAVTGRLQLEEQALADSTTVMRRVRELVLQANTATLTDSDRQAIVTELRARSGELQGIANRKDGNGDYLFSGYAATTPAFARDGTGQMTYNGDAGTRQLQVDDTQLVADSDPGSAVYRDIRAGNGTFTTAAAAGNAGSGVLDTGSVTDRTQWIADTYTLAFATPTTWQVMDSGGNTVASGSYVDGGTIAFRGVQVSVSGAPAAGDSFTLAPAATQDVFTTLDQLASALAGGASNDASRARLATSLNASLQQIDQAMANVSTVRATVGARLSLLSDAENARQSRTADLTAAVANLQDLDYAAAVSRMNQQYVSLQAAQQSYASISRLSLFSFL